MPTEGHNASTEVTYLEAIRLALQNEMDADSSVILLGQDVGDYGGAFKLSVGLKERFGEDRVIDTPVSESGMIGMAIGAALLGERPVVEMQFADFVTCGFNQLVNVAAKMYYRVRCPVPIVVRLPTGGGVGAGPFHSQSIEAWFLHVPGLKIVAPSTSEDAYQLLRAAIRDPNPVLFFEHKYLYRRVRGSLPVSHPMDHVERMVEGEAKGRVAREGSDVSVFTYGWMVDRSLEAAKLLEEEKISVEVFDLRILAPLDNEGIVTSVRKTGKAAVVHEAPRTMGFGAEIVSRIIESNFDDLDAPIVRIAYPDTPVPYQRRLEERSLPDPDRIARELRALHHR